MNFIAENQTIFENKMSKKKLYFANFPIDFFFLCGISFIIYTYAWTTKTFESTNEWRQVTSLLSWFINWPHFSATTYRLYSTKSHRDQFPTTTYIIPFVLIGFFLLGLSAPETIGVGFVKLYFLWSALHFSAQSFGITQLYLSRAEIKIDVWSRRLIYSSIYFSFVYTFIASQTGSLPQEYFALKIPTFQLPMALRTITGILYGNLMVLFVFWFFYQKVNKRNFPWMVLWIPLTQFIWYSVYFISFFNEFVPMLHCLQYLFLAYFIEAKEKGFDTGLSLKRFGLLWVSGKWYLLNVLGGAILFYYLPLIGPKLGYAHAGAFTALTWAFVQIHHFFVDGVIWKLRYSVSSSPLKTSWKEITGRLS